MTSTTHREGQPNSDAAISAREEWLLGALKPDPHRKFYGPDLYDFLREGIAARRGQRFGGHGS